MLSKADQPGQPAPGPGSGPGDKAKAPSKPGGALKAGAKAKPGKGPGGADGPPTGSKRARGEDDDDGFDVLRGIVDEEAEKLELGVGAAVADFAPLAAQVRGGARPPQPQPPCELLQQWPP